MKKKMSFSCAVIALTIMICLFSLIIVVKAEQLPNEVIFQKMTATAYCLRGKTCTDVEVRKGIAAAAPKYLGMVAAVYENNDGAPGEFIGYYEILDTGGEGIRSGKVLDIWMTTYEECIEFGAKDVLVVFVEGKG